jgi:hypothetical protein
VAPDAFVAVTVTVLVPSSSGIAGMFHCPVPLAVPEAPVELDQVIEVTPGVAVPLKAIVAADVETMFIAGLSMVRDGGPEGVVVSGGAVTGGVETAWYVTVIEADAVSPAASVTEMTIVFAPNASGTDVTDQFADPEAGPDPPWLLAQTTRRLPVPPLAVPEMAMDDEVVVTWAPTGLATARVIAAGAGRAPARRQCRRSKDLRRSGSTDT